MIDPTDIPDNDELNAAVTGDDSGDETESGETGSGTAGKGKSGRSEGGADTGITTAKFSRSGKGISLPPGKLKEVMGNWEYLDMAKAMAKVAEFFSELPARASANLQVSWSNVSQKGFAVISQAISFGQEVAQLLRSRDAGHIKKLRTKYGIKVTARPGTPGAAPAGTPGMR